MPDAAGESALVWHVTQQTVFYLVPPCGNALAHPAGEGSLVWHVEPVRLILVPWHIRVRVWRLVDHHIKIKDHVVAEQRACHRSHALMQRTLKAVRGKNTEGTLSVVSCDYRDDGTNVNWLLCKRSFDSLLLMEEKTTGREHGGYAIRHAPAGRTGNKACTGRAERQ